jgi:hypothetical protein
MITVSAVPTEHLAVCWPSVEAFLDGAAKRTYGRYTVSNIYDRIEEDGYQLWVAFDEHSKIKGAVVTNILDYPQRKVLSMTYCGGENLSEWKDPMLDILRRYAADMGCDCIEAVARKGWAKVFRADGYKERWVTFELPLKGAEHG